MPPRQILTRYSYVLFSQGRLQPLTLVVPGRWFAKKDWGGFTWKKGSGNKLGPLGKVKVHRAWVGNSLGIRWTGHSL